MRYIIEQATGGGNLYTDWENLSRDDDGGIVIFPDEAAAREALEQLLGGMKRAGVQFDSDDYRVSPVLVPWKLEDAEARAASGRYDAVEVSEVYADGTQCGSVEAIPGGIDGEVPDGWSVYLHRTPEEIEIHGGPTLCAADFTGPDAEAAACAYARQLADAIPEHARHPVMWDRLI